jgi:hypothetical protein
MVEKVKFIYQELPEDGAFITAQLAGNEVVYSVVLTKARNPLSRVKLLKAISWASFQRSRTPRFGTLSAEPRIQTVPPTAIPVTKRGREAN